MYVYKAITNTCFEVGYYQPDGLWYPESAWEKSDEAVERVHYLNGGVDKKTIHDIDYYLKELADWVKMIKQEGIRTY